MKEALELIRKEAGYRVHFEKRERSILSSDFFPDRDEPSIAELADAWAMAEKWAKVNPNVYVNVYVIHADDWTPVDGYQLRRLNTYPSFGAGDTERTA
jgi:hypothetical protein